MEEGQVLTRSIREEVGQSPDLSTSLIIINIRTLIHSVGLFRFWVGGKCLPDLLSDIIVVTLGIGMLVFSYSSVGPPNLNSWSFRHSIPHHDPHVVVLFLHLVAVITCVVLVL